MNNALVISGFGGISSLGHCQELFKKNLLQGCGQLAVIPAIEAVLAGNVDVCFALGALMDVSYGD